ncbi:MAG: LPXTG cell wall anchor domain-containing protein [Clostridiaceae bacterium]|nr:LPXTG cell wall anchor domain-containing protein [Eubacteriales bacterium]
MFVLRAFPATAATEEKPITALRAFYANGRVSYSGTAAQGVYAAAVLLFAPDGSLVMMDTCEIKPDGTFTGGISVKLAAGTYTVKASDYEGGEFSVAAFVRTADAVPDDNEFLQPGGSVPLPSPPPVGPAEVPKTGDNGGFLWLGLIASGALLGFLWLLRRGMKRA